jgi:uncharacterized protein (DUF3820 family)
MPPSLQPTQYCFDFGKHAGKPLDEIPAQYIEFLKQQGIVEGRPTLAVAVTEHGREQSQQSCIESFQSAPREYTLTFGKHIGKILKVVPDHYLTCLENSYDVYIENKALRDAVKYYHRVYDRYVHPPTLECEIEALRRVYICCSRKGEDKRAVEDRIESWYLDFSTLNVLTKAFSQEL